VWNTATGGHKTLITDLDEVKTATENGVGQAGSRRHWMNEMKVQWFKVRSKARNRLSLTHLPVQTLSRVKTLDGPRVHVVSPVVKEKVYGGKDLLKSQVLSSEWNTERLREDASGDSEDGEDDELPCVIGESAGDCVWRGSRRSAIRQYRRRESVFVHFLLQYSPHAVI